MWKIFCTPFYAFWGNHGYFWITNLQHWQIRPWGEKANILNFLNIDSMLGTVIHIRDQKFNKKCVYPSKEPVIELCENTHRAHHKWRKDL